MLQQQDDTVQQANDTLQQQVTYTTGTPYNRQQQNQQWSNSTNTLQQ